MRKIIKLEDSSEALPVSDKDYKINWENQEEIIFGNQDDAEMTMCYCWRNRHLQESLLNI